MEIADRDFMKSIRRGDVSSFSLLFNQYYSGLVVYANQFLSSIENSEDIVDDVFASLWEKRETLDPELYLKGYLFTSVRNRCLNHIEHLRVHSEYQKKILKKGDTGCSLTWEYFVESELNEMIEKALEKLPPQQKKVFMMSRFENKTAAQIAEELEISPRTVEKHIEKALQSLRADLKDYLPVALLIWLLNY
ncbi:RNA polymerase sigma-70 factor [Parabacteroides sp. APC149_11_2_Y6]